MPSLVQLSALRSLVLQRANMESSPGSGIPDGLVSVNEVNGYINDSAAEFDDLLYMADQSSGRKSYSFSAPGGADMVSGLFRHLLWNKSIPDELRGRLAGVELVSYSVGPQLGQVRASVTAQLTSLRTSIGIGGIACAVTCIGLAFALPTLWEFDDRTDVNVRQRSGNEDST